MSWRSKTLGDLLEANARERGDAEALVTPTARLTWAQLQHRARSAAADLQARGLAPGDRVGILIGNGEDWLSLFYGAALIGAVTVPVNTRFKAAEIAYCLKQSDAKALYYAETFLKIDFEAMMPEVAAALPALKRISLGSVDWMAETKPVLGPSPADLLLIQFTSGTTAYPKGVMLTHDNMLRNAWAAGTRIGCQPQDRYFNCRPFFHVGGSTLSALMSLAFGCCLATLPTFEAGAALAMLEQERCTLISGNDTIFQMLMGHEDLPKRRLHLRGGWAAAGPLTMRAIIDKLGMKHVCAAYGLSEASPNVVMNDWRDPEELRVQGLAKTHEGLEIRISPQGEIQVRGWSVMKGYCNNPEATAEAFTEDGWLRTGDLGEIVADGRLRMVGRLKDVFRVGGENVAPAQVEQVLLSHPAVQTAQVVGVPDPRLGEVGCAYVTLKDGAQASEAELLAHARARCANFRVPRYLRIVADFEAIGMTASGKVQKSKLREHALKQFNLVGGVK